MSNKKVHFKKSGGSFQHEWLNIYKWLKYDAATKRMFCTICKAHGEKKINLQEKVINKYN